MRQEYIIRKCPFHAVKMFEFPDVLDRELIRKMLGDISAVVDEDLTVASYENL